MTWSGPIVTVEISLKICEMLHDLKKIREAEYEQTYSIDDLLYELIIHAPAE